MADAGQPKAARQAPAPFPADDLRRFVESNAAAVRAAGVADFVQIAHSLDQIANDLPTLSEDLESLEQRLTVLEQKLIALARAGRRKNRRWPRGASSILPAALQK